jgi:hypothetical protein
MTDGQDEKPATDRRYLGSWWDKHYLPRHYRRKHAPAPEAAPSTVPPVFYLSTEETRRLTFLRYMIATGSLVP